MSAITKRVSRTRRSRARRLASPIRMTEPIRSTKPVHTTGTATRSRSHRSDAMYLLNEAMARARCAEQQPSRPSRPAREVAVEAARRRRGSR
jgi:hypothetical protein